MQKSATNPTVLDDLPPGWSVKSIDELCARVTSGGTPLRTDARYFRGGTIPWYKTQELRGWYVGEPQEKITPAAIQESSAKILPPHTILMAMYGDGKTITSLGILGHEAACNQACCALVVEPTRCDYRFLFYALRYHREDFIHIATGGAQRNLSGTLIRNFCIRAPSLSEQAAIGALLAALDAKIDLNRRTSETLENIARAIFKSWFVDFDPVRAKAEGRQPAGMGPQTATLFPSAFTDSETDQIPTGWSSVKVDSVIEIKREGLNPGESAGETFDHYSIPAFDDGRMPKQESGEVIKSNKFIVPSQTVLLSKLNPRFPRVWLPEVNSIHRAVCSTEFIVLEPKPGVSREFVYCLFGSLAFAESFSGLVTGTSSSHQRVKPEDFLHMLVTQPPQALVARFTELVGPMLKHNAALIAQSLALSFLRDALLPKLLTGELRVRDAEKIVEAHV